MQGYQGNMRVFPVADNHIRDRGIAVAVLTIDQQRVGTGIEANDFKFPIIIKGNSGSCIGTDHRFYDRVCCTGQYSSFNATGTAAGEYLDMRFQAIPVVIS